MRRNTYRVTHVFILLLTGFMPYVINGQIGPDIKKNDSLSIKLDSTESAINKPDTLPYPFKNGDKGTLYLDNPVDVKVHYDFKKKLYVITQIAGGYQLKNPIYLTREKYSEFLRKKYLLKYMVSKSRELDEINRQAKKGKRAKRSGNILPSFTINSKLFETIFGGNTIEFIPSGYVTLDLAGLIQNVENPEIPASSRTKFTFDFDQKIQLGLTGKVGENVTLSANYDTKFTFGFENQIKFGYTGKEDEIVKSLEVGNISMPLRNSLVVGPQSLFGVKTELQFGNTFITGAFSQQESETKTIEIQNGGRVINFKISAFDYQENTGYFLSQYFRENYDEWLKKYPNISSKIKIKRIQVWVANKKSTEKTNNRNLVAFTDLGESKFLSNKKVVRPLRELPGFDMRNRSKNSNDIYRFINNKVRGDVSSAFDELQQRGFRNPSDFETIENARLLSESEYKFHEDLGYIILNQPLEEDQKLAVAFEYTRGGRTYQVGEFSDQVSTSDTDAQNSDEKQQNLIVKMLKNHEGDVKNPLWDLMMKNIYPLGGYGIESEDFRLDILFKDNTKGSINYLPINSGQASPILLALLRMDRLNRSGEPVIARNADGKRVEADIGDGFFDFLPETIDTENGFIIFSTVQPFGGFLRKQLRKINADQQDVDRYVIDEIYTNTKTEAEGTASEKNKIFLNGYFKASESGSGISLGSANIPQGSVKVTHNGSTLVENVDYIVDYQLGRIEIINDAIASSGSSVQVSVEDNSSLNLQTRRFIGLNVEHRFSEDFIVGATYLNYRERPITQKVSYGVEPVNNSMLGANIEFSKETPFLTRMVNKLPFINTEAPSSISIGAEFAYLKPGSPSNIDIDGGATSFIDDFEDAQTERSILDVKDWALASTPGGEGQEKFRGNTGINDLTYGYDRAKLAWYTIDPLFYGLGSGKPEHISADDLSKNDVRRIYIRELFPNKEVVAGTSDVLSTLDLTYFPTERGPYNFNPEDVDGIDNPRGAWAGIMKPIFTSNFEKANVEFIEFWLLDPFLEDNSNPGGDIYIHLGNVSEDILKDGRKQYENGLPNDGEPDLTAIDTTWGRVPSARSVNYDFTTQGVNRAQQDLGFDGLNDEGERIEFGSNFGDDPSRDNFRYFLDPSYNNSQASIIERYRDYNGTQGNSSNGNNSATASPDIEDLNEDQTLNRIEKYYEYKVRIKPDSLKIGQNFVTDIRESTASLGNGGSTNVRWYQFKIPISEGRPIGNISNFRSIRFMRMVLTDFEQRTTLRFGTLDLVRTEWKRFTKTLKTDDEGKDDNTATGLVDNNDFEISDVNLIENSNRSPIPYVLPPGVDRESLFNQTQVQNQNEGAMVLRVENIEPNDARAAYRSGYFDLRRYKRLRMFIHAEKLNSIDNLEDGDVSAFLRIGDDLTDNYYEYEIPLTVTSAGSNTPEAIWPEQNSLDITLDELIKAKLARDKKKSEKIGDRYRSEIGERGHIIWIKGRPSLSEIRSLMLGVRNNQRSDRSAEVWFNELRLTGFETEGAWAASGKVDVHLADFSNISISGNRSGSGFGGIDQTLIERSQEDELGYNVNTQTNLGMITPKKWGLRLPLNYSFSEQFIDPKYNPLDKDVKISRLEENTRDSILDISRDYTRRLNLSLINFGKERTSEKPKRFFDVENLSFTYIYNKTYHKDIHTSYEISKDLRTAVDYNYQFKPLEWQLFKGRETEADTIFTKKILSEIKNIELNFNPLPSRVSFRTEINRKYDEELYRDLQLGSQNIRQSPISGYDFGLKYEYDIGFDLTRSLSLDYTSSTNRLIENIGVFGRTPIDPNIYIEQADQNLIYKDFLNFGRPKNYHQTVGARYKLPTQFIPYLDWLESDINYTADYDWEGRSLSFIEDGSGNVIQNQLGFQGNSRFDFETLYSYFPYMEIYNQKIENWGSGKKAKGKIKTADGKSYTKRMTLKDYGFMLLTSIKSGELQYSQSKGMVLPGFLDEVGFFGRGRRGPSLAFTLGDQVNVLERGLLDKWNFTQESLQDDYQRTKTENLDYQFSLELIPDLNIELLGRRVYSESQNFNGFNDPNVNIIHTINGSFNITSFTLGTSFKDPEEVFQNFQNNRLDIARRLASSDTRSDSIRVDGFPKGYSGTNQSIVIPAFLAAYNGKTGGRARLSPFRNFPLPNWALIYSGLIKFKWFKKHFETLDIRHAYKSAYSVNNFETNLKYQEAQQTSDPEDDLDESRNFLNSETISGINIIDSFEPLIGVGFSLKNGVQASLDYKKDRNLSLSLHSNSITEIIGSEIVLGLGYIIKDVQFNMRIAGKRRRVKSDLNLKADLSVRNTKTVIRKFADGDNQITGGQSAISIKAKADYSFTKYFNLSLFYNHDTTKYAISTAFPVSNIRFGLSARLAFN